MEERTRSVEALLEIDPLEPRHDEVRRAPSFVTPWLT